jgi:glycosyltransferase involved in cell wall biosynthesis
VTSAFVGAEASAFPSLPPRPREDRAKVLFYGQFIPLHGIATIIAAARLSGDRPIDWVVIGTGQMATQIRENLQSDPPAALEWEEWVPYPDLVRRIAQADVCLGVFGDSDKAGRVIPNKVFQILSAGRPLVTRDGPGIRELVPEGAPGIGLVPPDDPAALLAAVERLLAETPFPPDLHAGLRDRFALDALSARWDGILRDATDRAR